MKLEIRKIGHSLGVILPKQVIDNLRVSLGDNLRVIETEAGILLTPYDPEVDTAMKAYKAFSQQYKNALRKLSK